MIRTTKQNREIWKPVKGYSKLYQVSNYGRVKSSARYASNNGGLQFRPEKFLVKIKKTTGYEQVTLSKNSIQCRVLVHRLVAETFIPNPENKKQVNHLDGERDNNNVNNLEWCTPSENGLHAYKVLKIKPSARGKFGFESTNGKPVIQLTQDNKVVKIYGSMLEAQRAGFEASCICRCCKNQSKLHKNFKWKYA